MRRHCALNCLHLKDAEHHGFCGGPDSRAILSLRRTPATFLLNPVTKLPFRFTRGLRKKTLLRESQDGDLRAKEGTNA